MHNKQSKQIYEKPTLKVVSFVVEHGFAGSGEETNAHPQQGISSESMGENADYSDITYF